PGGSPTVWRYRGGLPHRRSSWLGNIRPQRTDIRWCMWMLTVSEAIYPNWMISTWIPIWTIPRLSWNGAKDWPRSSPTTTSWCTSAGKPTRPGASTWSRTVRGQAGTSRSPSECALTDLAHVVARQFPQGPDLAGPLVRRQQPRDVCRDLVGVRSTVTRHDPGDDPFPEIRVGLRGDRRLGDRVVRQ